MASDLTKDAVLKELKARFQQLNIDITPREEFESKFKNYKANWKELI